MKKLFLWIFVIFFVFSGCGDGNENFEQTPFSKMEIVIFDIGKADAILITTENYTVLIDTGENKHGQQIADYLWNLGINRIDYLIITHFHKDHAGGAGSIIRNLAVKEVIVPNYGKESKHYDRLIAAMEEAELESSILTETIEFTLDGAEFTVYPAQREYFYYDDDDESEDYDEDLEDSEDENISITNENNYSIVVSVSHGENHFLFTGDAKSARLKELFATEEIMSADYDFLKVPHHGRYNKRAIDFIYMLKPEYAVITCSADGYYPADKRVITALEDSGSEIYFTADGNVHCISDGMNLTVEYK